MKKNFLLTFLLGNLLFPVFSFSQAEETLTISTYYPAPYGVYNELRSKKMAIGDTYYDGSQYCWAPAVCTDTIYSSIDLAVKGTVSIGTNLLPLTNPKLYVVGPVEADAFRAFEASGVYAFIEAGPNDGAADMGGYSLATSSFARTRLDGNPLVLQSRSGGNIGIGTQTPDDAKVEVFGGTVCADTNSDGLATSCISIESDIRLKKNIARIENALDKLEKIKGVTFDWRWDEYEQIARFKAKPHDIGLIAQEVEAVFPQALNEGIGEFKSVNYNAMVAVLVEAVKEQQKEIESQQEEIKSLKTQIQSLQSAENEKGLGEKEQE